MTQVQTAFENILYEVRDHVAIITMNKPERLNAINRVMRLDLARAFRMAEEDDDVRCVVYTGTGRAFSSGGDHGGDQAKAGQVTESKVFDSSVWDWYLFLEGPHGKDGNFGARDIHKPVIAAVNGLAYGAAGIILTQCDIVIASDQARFCFIETRMGFTGGGTLPYVVGPQWAKILLLTGDVIGAKRAERIGLVAAVVPHDQLMARTLDMARRIAAMPRYGVMLNKAAVDGAMDMMGWAANERFSHSHSAVIQGMTPYAEAPNGRRLGDILKDDGFKAFLQARDEAHKESWFKDDE